jgi:Flp pilus assembly protein TadD
LHLGLLHRTPLVTAAIAGAMLSIAGVRPSPAQPPRFSDMPSEANLGGPPPFSSWGPEAREVFEREHRHAKYAAEIHYDLGLWFYERADYELSLKHYRKAGEIDPSFPEPYFGIGLLFYTLGDDENAARYYEMALERNPKDADVHNNLGLIYYRRGELETARVRLQEAIRLQPTFPDAMYNLGLVYYQQKQLPAAVAQFESALQLDPEYHRARFNLGVVYYELGRRDLAEEQWAKIQQAAPGTALAEQAGENLAILRANGTKK